MEKEGARAIILKNNDDILVIHRINERGNYYVFPGGRIEEGETPQEAVLREINEETSLVVEVKKPIDFHTSQSKEYYFLCDYISGEPRLREKSEEAANQNEQNQYNVQWLPLDELSDITLYPTVVKDKLIEMLVNDSALADP